MAANCRALVTNGCVPRFCCHSFAAGGHFPLPPRRKVQKEKLAAGALQQALALNKKGDKKNAVFYLKRHKAAKAQVDKFCAMQETVEAQMTALQSVNINREHLNAMAEAASVMKEAQKDINVERLEEVRETFEEAMDNHVEVESEFARAWVRDTVDESDLMAELDALGEADLTEGLVAAPAVTAGAGASAAAPAPATELPHMPAVPTGKVEMPAAPAAPARVAIAAGAGGGGGGGKEMDMLAELAGLE